MAPSWERKLHRHDNQPHEEGDGKRSLKSSESRGKKRDKGRGAPRVSVIEEELGRVASVQPIHQEPVPQEQVFTDTPRIVSARREQELLTKYGELLPDQKERLRFLMKKEGYTREQINAMEPIQALDIADTKGLISLEKPPQKKRRMDEDKAERLQKGDEWRDTNESGDVHRLEQKVFRIKPLRQDLLPQNPVIIPDMEKSAVAPDQEAVPPTQEGEHDRDASWYAEKGYTGPTSTYAEKRKGLEGAVKLLVNREERLKTRLDKLRASAAEKADPVREYYDEFYENGLRTFKDSQSKFFDYKREQIAKGRSWKKLWRNGDTAEGKKLGKQYESDSRRFRDMVKEVAETRLNALSGQEWEKLYTQQVKGSESAELQYPDIETFKEAYIARKVDQALGLVVNHSVVREAGILEQQVITESFAQKKEIAAARQMNGAEKTLRSMGAWYMRQPRAVKYAIGAGIGLAITGGAGVGLYAARKVFTVVGGAAGAALGKWTGNKIVNRFLGENKRNAEAKKVLQEGSALRGSDSSADRNDIIKLLSAEDRIARAEKIVKTVSVVGGAVLGGAGGLALDHAIFTGVPNVAEPVHSASVGHAEVAPADTTATYAEHPVDSSSVSPEDTTSTHFAPVTQEAPVPQGVSASVVQETAAPQGSPIGIEHATPATPAEVPAHVEPVSVTVGNGQGSISMFQSLKNELLEKYPNPSEAPESAQHILNSDAESLAKEYGFYKPGSIDESALLEKGSTLGFNDHGDLVFSQDGTTVTPLTHESAFSGKFIDTDRPAPVPAPVEAPVETPAAPVAETVATPDVKPFVEGYVAPKNISDTIAGAAHQSPEFGRAAANHILDTQHDPESLRALAKAAKHLEPDAALEKGLIADVSHKPHLYILSNGRFAVFSNPDMHMSAADTYKLQIAAAQEAAKETGQTVYVPYSEGREYAEVLPRGEVRTYGGLWGSPPKWMDVDRAVLEVDGHMSTPPIEAATSFTQESIPVAEPVTPSIDQAPATHATEAVAAPHSITERVDALKATSASGAEVNVPRVEMHDDVIQFKTAEWTKMHHWTDKDNVYVVGKGTSPDIQTAAEKAELNAKSELAKLLGSNKVTPSGISMGAWIDPKTGVNHTLMRFPKTGIR